jgi:hypothetical protein
MTMYSCRFSVMTDFSHPPPSQIEAATPPFYLLASIRSIRLDLYARVFVNR